MTRRPSLESASVSALFVCLVSALLAVSALTFEGGRRIDTYAELSVMAASTGRVGAQEITGLRSNRMRINREEAVRAMESHLAGTGVGASYEVTDTRIRVTLRREAASSWLTGFGVLPRSVVVSRSIEIVSG